MSRDKEMHIAVLDLETQRSANDCRYCGAPIDFYDDYDKSPCSHDAGHAVIGWDNKADLGLSIGCYWDSRIQRMTFFDEDTLEDTVRALVAAQLLLVSFNGMSFDGPLMRGLLRRRAEALPEHEERERLVLLCDAFKAQWATSYDLLAEIWKVAPADKRARGLNSLDAIAQANGLGAKLSHGAQAPRDWAVGRWARVLNYCSDDVYKTKALFDMVLRGDGIRRANGSIVYLPKP